MERALKTEEELERLIAEASIRVPLGLYQHYKNGNQYLVTGLAIQRYSGEVCVEYQAQYGKKLNFVRTLDEWFLPATCDGKEVLRFNKL